MVNFTLPKTHPQGRVGGLNRCKDSLFRRICKSGLIGEGNVSLVRRGEKGESWDLLPRLLAGEVVPLQEGRGAAVTAHRLIHYVYE